MPDMHTYAIYVFIALLFYAWVSSLRAAHWKAKYEQLQFNQSGQDGWREEARFWRRHFNKSAAEAVEE